MHEIPKCWCCFRIPCNLSNCKRLNYKRKQQRQILFRKGLSKTEVSKRIKQ
jgi:hypothetical protein